MPSIPSLTPLSPSVSIYTPPSPPPVPPRPSTITPPPHLILLCTYLNASPQHITRYISGYRRLFPASRILVVTTSSADFLFRPAATRIAGLNPAVQSLLHLQSRDQAQSQSGDMRSGSESRAEKESVLLHVISTGGAAAAVAIAETYKKRTGEAMPVAKVLFDSCPGVAGYESTVGAFSVGIRSGGWSSGWAFLLGVGLRVFFSVWFLVEGFLGLENVVNHVRRGLNDPSLFRPDAARLYIYSGRDKLVHAQDVEDHADEAEKIGYEVTRVRYLDSEHAGHLLYDAERFWGSVKGLWDSAVLSGPGMIVCAW